MNDVTYSREGLYDILERGEALSPYEYATLDVSSNPMRVVFFCPRCGVRSVDVWLYPDKPMMKICPYCEEIVVLKPPKPKR